MSFNLNNVALAGNLTRDPVVKMIGGDRAVAEFGLAINRKFKTNSGESREEVTFVDVSAWGRTAELVGQYLRKGSPAYIEGRLNLESWEDKATGAKRSKLKVVADRVQFIGPAPKRDGDGEQGSTVHSPAAAAADERAAARAPASKDDDEPPF